MNSDALTRIMDRLDPEIWVVTASNGLERGGLVATFVARASIVSDRPRMLVGLSRCHHTHSLVESSGAMALHLLRAAQLDLVWRFGLQSGRDHDKFSGLAVRTGVTGAPILIDALGSLEGRVEARLDTGDRTVSLVEIVHAAMNGDEAPLTMRQMLAAASRERLQELKRQLEADENRDRALIDAWRRQRA